MAGRGVCIVEHKRRRLSWSLVALAGIAASLVGCRQPPPPPSGTNIPIVFVHGIVGSGDQYRAMAQYWASNGFPAERVRAYDYNSVGGTAAIGPFIDQVMREFNVSKVHLVGHSLGTIYVAAFAPTSNKVDRWFLVDGAGCGAGQSRCAAVHQADLRAVGGGNQTHVETSVSPESFARQYQHFMGRAPATTKVVPETGSTIRVAGRVQEFMANSAVSNAQVRIWETDPNRSSRVRLARGDRLVSLRRPVRTRLGAAGQGVRGRAHTPGLRRPARLLPAVHAQRPLVAPEHGVDDVGELHQHQPGTEPRGHVRRSQP